jgi:hypothetical protein
MTADMIRASLLARATVTPRAGLREKRGQPIARSVPFRLPATRNNEVAPPPSLAAIAPPSTRPVALFAAGAGLLFAAAGILPRRRSERGGKVAPRLENFRVRRAGGDRGGDLCNARNAGQPSADRVLRMGGDRLIEGGPFD